MEVERLDTGDLDHLTVLEVDRRSVFARDRDVRICKHFGRAVEINDINTCAPVHNVVAAVDYVEGVVVSALEGIAASSRSKRVVTAGADQ
jgi:hypothetical protein